MYMNKQIKLHSINLGMVKTNREKQLYKMKYTNDGSLFRRRHYISKWIKNSMGVTDWNKDCDRLFKDNLNVDKSYINLNNETRRISKIIDEEIKLYNKNNIRFIDSKYFKEDTVIAFFENTLTRTLSLKPDEITNDFIVIEVKRTDMKIVKQIIENGLIIRNRYLKHLDKNGLDVIEVKDEKYKFFTAGAGQTRQKKFMMIKEEIWDKYEKDLMCGLTISKINDMGGMNTNKFNAYLSLNNSASDVIDGFDIDRCIVVDDFSETINEEVDYISRHDDVLDEVIKYKTRTGKIISRAKYRTEWNISRQFMDVPIDFMDGAGICLNKIFKKNTQIRMPWFKGILCPIDYIRYIKENGLSTKITDLWGKEYDVIDDNIQVIFTKSQFKLWKYYKNIIDKDNNVFMTGWEVYKACFKHHECTLNKCLEDEDRLKNMNINYQMLQTLNKISDNQIELLTNDTKEIIDRVHSSIKEQLSFLGAVKENNHRSYLQEITRLYPEILSSKYMKKQLSDTITKYKKEAKSGRIKMKAKRVFIIPDLIHFCSILFGDGSDYALDKGQVSFSVYKKCNRLALLRSPHLSREWAIKENVFNEKTKYFKTNGVYVNARDLMSLVLMNDWDGDEALILEDCKEQKWLLDVAEEQMKDLRPIYYEMGGGDAQEINLINEFKSLKFVYEKSNIGRVSNTLTNIWSKDDCENNMDNIKKICAYNNYIIDSAKKLELPKLPKDIKAIMNNKDYPYFFQFAKGKDKNDCRPIGNGVIDRICKSIDNIKYKEFNYSKGFGKFKIVNLLGDKKNKDKIISEELKEFYKLLLKESLGLINEYAKKYKRITENKEECNFNYKELVYNNAKVKINEYCKANSIKYEDIVDIIINYAFNHDNMNLAFIFNVFGDYIIENINKNIKLSIDNPIVKMCECCGKRFEKTTINSNQMYCEKCAKKINIEKTISNRLKRKKS